MANLDAALVEVREVEAFMRRRYLYNHPIFAHITAAIELLETEVAAQTPPPPAEPEQAEPEIEAATEPPVAPPTPESAIVPEAAEQDNAEGKPPARRARRKRG